MWSIGVLSEERTSSSIGTDEVGEKQAFALPARPEAHAIGCAPCKSTENSGAARRVDASTRLDSTVSTCSLKQEGNVHLGERWSDWQNPGFSPDRFVINTESALLTRVGRETRHVRRQHRLTRERVGMYVRQTSAPGCFSRGDPTALHRPGGECNLQVQSSRQFALGEEQSICLLDWSVDQRLRFARGLIEVACNSIVGASVG